MPESLPEEWLRKEFERLLSAEEKVLLTSLGGLDQLLATLNQRLSEQKERHAGGNKWVGTGGSSPFGHGGFHPEGVRMGERASMARRSRCGRRATIATSATTRRWDNGPSSWRCASSGAGCARATRRAGSDDTIQSTARQGWLDVKLRPERHNGVKLLVFFDVGAPWMPTWPRCSALLGPAPRVQASEYFYFHNCLYDFVWQDNARRQEARFDTLRLLRTYGSDYKVILVGMPPWAPTRSPIWRQRRVLE